MRRFLVIGAASAIAHETMKHAAREGGAFYLVGRTQHKLNAVADDLKAQGAHSATPAALDLTEHDQHAALIQQATDALGGLDVVFVAHGTLTDQARAQKDAAYALHDFDVNFTSTLHLLTLVAQKMEAQQRGLIVVISSVAGDRGRGSNYVYGSAMAAKTAFVSGLRNRLSQSNVHVMTVKPGFVDTPMTADVPKNPLFASAPRVGASIYQAMKQQRDLIYVPFFWRYIMFIIRAIPESIFKRLGL